MPAAGVTKEKTLTGTQHLETIVLGAGCFWGVEKRYAALPGVTDAVSGYADGEGVAPNYRAITASQNRHNPHNHAEVVQVTFNSQIISLTEILQRFFENHDPTQVNRQGNDIGTQYRSLILTRSEQQATVAQQVLADYQVLLSQAGMGRIATEIKPLQTFYPAEDYHQDYLAKNPAGYCPDHATGVRFGSSQVEAVDNQSLLQGKQILVIDAPDCPFCEQFKQDVTDAYQGSIPLHTRRASQLQGLTLQTPTWATPTLVFLEDGREVLARQGYVDAETFYRLLGAFKLGNTEAFRVAFEEGTDARFCRQYEAFKDTPDGVFIDKLSGAALFDTKDRFNSGSGWLSFTRAVPGAVYEKPDNRYGMRRVEIRSVVSDIHLGHVFDDGPGGQPRYCINATVLEFRPH
ncbi:MAG: peptide-methionine (S)-S-oxide reductase MsrA [Pseudomonadota bacterium]